MKKITALLAFLLISLGAYSQNNMIDGKWWGRLDVSGRKLTIGFDIRADAGLVEKIIDSIRNNG